MPTKKVFSPWQNTSHARPRDLYPSKVFTRTKGKPMTKRNQHVVPHPNGWAVKGENATRPSAVAATQQEAIVRAREITRNQGTELFIHGENGRIRERDSHGRDPKSSPG
jgi:hypothetical protein